MAHKLGVNFNGGIKELKLGNSFNKGFKEESYHTIRYDFKPASVDSQKVGSLEVVNKEVTLTVPLMGGGGSAQEAVFKGNKTPTSKDCLLIIDNVTGEIVLERISQHIRVKKTRTEGGNRKPMQRGMAQDLRPNKPSPSQNHSTSSPHGARPSPSHRSPPQSKSPNHKVSNSSRSQPAAAAAPAATAAASSATPGSMPMLNFEEDHKNDSIMSDSSSDSDSNSGSSSSSDSDSDSEPEPKVANPNPPSYTANGHGSLRNGLPNNHKSPSSISVLSDLELSEED